MRTFLTSICLALLVSVGASQCSGAQGLVGLWQAETVRTSPPGRTNIVESYHTLEFLRDGSFKSGGAITTDGEKRTLVAFTGTYALIDTNHIRLEIAPSRAQPSDKIPLTVKFSIVGDELEIEKFNTNVVPATQKYRRVKQ